MKKFDGYTRFLTWLMALTLGALLAACGGGGGGSGGRDPVLGTGGNPSGGNTVVAPTVTAVAPPPNATGIPISTKIITAAFSKPMDPTTLTPASFTLACPAGTAVTGGTVSYLATGNVATLTLSAGTTLPANTVCTATITTAAKDTTGVALANNFVWTFTTGITPDTTRPTVVLTVPATTIPGPTPGVPTNTAISAVFSEDMAPATINTASFTVTCAAPCVSPANATVVYTVGSRTAVFAPPAALAANTTYTATITAAATDLDGNGLAGNLALLPAASNYVWTFTTSAVPVPPGNVTVRSTNPSNGAAVATNAAINVTFNTPPGLRMDPATLNTATFIVTGPGTTPVSGTVVFAAAQGVGASFFPASLLTAGVTYTATIKGGANGVKDLAIPANTMVNDYVWTFTVATNPPVIPPSPFPLKSAATFGTFGGTAGMTNQGLLTVINGDIGTTAISTAVTGFHDATPGCTYTETPLNVGTVNGKIYTAPPPPTVGCPTEGTGTAAPPVGTFGIATVAAQDALAAYNALAAAPVVGTPLTANLSGQTVPPGVYVAPGGGFLIQNGTVSSAGDLTLDGLGDSNAVWVFKMATTLTVGGPGAAFPRSINLINGAQAKNVFWQVGSFATINAGGGGIMQGTIISQAGVSFSTPGNVTLTTLNGRALSLVGSVTVVNTIITVPAP